MTDTFYEKVDFFEDTPLGPLGNTLFANTAIALIKFNNQTPLHLVGHTRSKVDFETDNDARKSGAIAAGEWIANEIAIRHPESESEMESPSVEYINRMRRRKYLQIARAVLPHLQDQVFINSLISTLTTQPNKEVLIELDTIRFSPAEIFQLMVT